MAVGRTLATPDRPRPTRRLAPTRFQLRQPTNGLQLQRVDGLVHAISSPSAQMCVEGIVDVMGTARGAAFSSYTLEFSASGNDPWTLINQSNVTVSSGSLGLWDTSSLSEGYYKVPGGHLRIFRGKELQQEIEHLGFKHYARHWAHALHAPFWWLKCLFWNSQDSNWLVRQYHKLLVWDLMESPALTRTLEKLMNPIMGKSVVMYFRKEAAS